MNNPTFLWGFFINATFITVGYISSFSRVKSGGLAVASLANATLINSRHLRHPKYQQLDLIVDEICLAARINKPAIYVSPYKTINAFVAGWHYGDTVLTVHAGAIFYLSREELSALVAHEITHLVHEDTKEDLFILRSILAFSWVRDLGYNIFTNFRSFGDYFDYRTRVIASGHASVTIGIFLYLAGSIFYMFGYFMRSMISKQREYFADAGAVFLTRQDTGMLNVLRKSWYQAENYTQHKDPRNSHLEHFYTFNFNSTFDYFSSTHPPIEKRLKNLSQEYLDPLKFNAVDIITPRQLDEEYEQALSKQFAETKETDRFISNALETPSQTQALLAMLTGMPELLPTLNYQTNAKVIHEFDATQKIETINLLFQRISQWSAPSKKSLLSKMKHVIDLDKKVSHEEYLWYTLLKYRLFPPTIIRTISPTYDDVAIFLNHIDNYTAHEYLPDSLLYICEQLDIEHYQNVHLQKDEISLLHIERSIKNIQQWNPLIKPILTVEMAKHIDNDELDALLWLNTLCTAIDSPVPNLSSD